MPARNALPYLDVSIASILGQSFGDFEFVIRDDGSTDGTSEVLRDWAARDRRIRLFEGSQLGPAGASNAVVAAARAPLVARMDADDVARGDRLERQMAAMAASPDLVLLGSLFETIDGEGRVRRGPDLWRLARRSPFVPFAHASALFRRAAFERTGGYRRACDYWEDLDLFLRLAELGPVAVVAEPLLAHRATMSSSRLVASEEARIEAAVDRMYTCVALYQRGESYEPVVRAPLAPGGRVSPMVFVSLNSNRLWAGESPRPLGRMLRRARLRFDAETAVAFLWALAAEIAPGLLRGFLRALVRARGVFVRSKLRYGDVCRWKPARDEARLQARSHALAAGRSWAGDPGAAD
jgi:glycosyltransferase involved in cell wall biosynthesis